MASILKDRAAQPIPDWSEKLQKCFVGLVGASAKEMVFSEDSLIPNAHQHTLATTQQLLAWAAQAGVFIHETALEADWWRQDRGQLLGLLENGIVPVLLQWSHWQGSYTYRNPVSEEKVTIEQANVGSLEPIAYQAYPALQEDNLSKLDYLRFGLKQNLSASIFLCTYIISAAIALVSLPFFAEKLWAQPNFKNVMSLALLGTVWLCLSYMKEDFLRSFYTQMHFQLQLGLYHRMLHYPFSFFRNMPDEALIRKMKAFKNISRQSAPLLFALILWGSIFLGSCALWAFFHTELAFAGCVCGVLCLLLSLFLAKSDAYDRAAVEGRQAKQAFQFHDFLKNIIKWKTHRMYENLMPSLEAQANDLQFNRQKADRKKLGQSLGLYIGFGLLALFLLQINVQISNSFALFWGMLWYALALDQLWRLSPRLWHFFQDFNAMTDLLQKEFSNNKKRLPIQKGAITLEKVCFAYDGRTVLQDVSLEIKAGSLVAITGSSGAGKSTLLAILSGMLQPSSGQVLIDGQPLEAYSLYGLKVIRQNSRVNSGLLFGTVLGQRTEDLPLSAAWEFVEKAGMKAEIEAMPMQLQMVISEQGHTLSGGQKQRLLLANAFAEKPKILLLDEAFSALDDANTVAILRQLKEMGMTIVLCTHKRSAIAIADQVYAL